MAMARSCWPNPRGCSPACRALRSWPLPTRAPRWRPTSSWWAEAPRAPARCSRSSAATTPDGAGRAVLRLDADGWHREPVDTPEPVHPVALAAAGPGREWMLATAGDRVVLLRRDPTGPRWELTGFDDELLNAAAKVDV